ncbi:MAG: death-on-curing family protein [Candidatus Peregrinibacteria bacterium GW2011_GWF2_43_17]|nr:MAG: death-on-curing family protein [Candidatus Peregrinibacteria bacterium GW2011_GWF2_43_17]KKT19393.1 MAG: RhuM [Candidatus Peregrinibacteria bacterium GW2011_GWA2_43_8]
MVKTNKQVVIYQSKSGAIELRGDFEKDTLWATQAQVAVIFDLDRSVVTKHIRNILRDKELDEYSVCAKFAHTANDGKTYQVQFYNLDVILAVGYRANSVRAIQFRQWATKTLRAHIVDGYTINKKRLEKNYGAFLKAVEDVRKLLPSGGAVDAGSALELVKMFASTWLSLDAYDRSYFPKIGVTKKQVGITAEDLAGALSNLKKELMSKRQASHLFGAERAERAVEGILGNVFQSFGGAELYPTVEVKAAHLLYFMVKNHPFVDGNKRNGAFAFVWFLRRAGILNPSCLSAEALTALTLLVAESNSKDKERMIGLILMLITK